jgi:AcrR family transcriptional regulator
MITNDGHLLQARGPEHHAMRDRIVAAAEARFRRDGYARTTVADLAGDLRISTAYVYKFFPSKTAICEAVCGEVLSRIDAELWRIARSDVPPEDRLERLFRGLLSETVALLFKERKLHDMTKVAMDHRWASVERHKAAMRDTAAHVIEAGRATGAFETATPLDEQAQAVTSAMVAFAHPAVIEHALDSGQDLPAQAVWTARLVTRGLKAR